MDDRAGTIVIKYHEIILLHVHLAESLYVLLVRETIRLDIDGNTDYATDHTHVLNEILGNRACQWPCVLFRSKANPTRPTFLIVCVGDILELNP